jgi:hypothetical protein
MARDEAHRDEHSDGREMQSSQNAEVQIMSSEIHKIKIYNQFKAASQNRGSKRN